MRYGIFSDTHANLDALEAVLREFDKAKVDCLVCIGDTVGYGALPDPCCDHVRTKTRHTILGNHDAAVAGRMDYSYYYDAARQALDHHASQLSESNMEWLKNLPYDVNCGDTHFCHGSPVDL
jgi:predicted phosphodiesterase